MNTLSTKLKGRIFGLSTNDGRNYNARLVNETPCYATIYDNNAGSNVKIAKSNIQNIRCGK